MITEVIFPGLFDLPENDSNWIFIFCTIQVRESSVWNSNFYTIDDPFY